MKTVSNSHIGVDISKDFLDIAVWPSAKTYRIRNTKDIIEKFLKRHANQTTKITCEATGGYEYYLCVSARRLNLSIDVVRPSRIRNFCKAKGVEAKTDSIDANMIAEFGIQMLNEKRVSVQREDELHALKCRRDHYISMRTQEKQRSQIPLMRELCSDSFEDTLQFFDQKIAEIDQKMEAIIARDKELVAKKKILTSCKGVGDIAARALLASCPEIGKLKDKELASLVGVSPYNHQSGNREAQAHIRNGRDDVRKILYICTLSATRCNPHIKAFYERLLKKGKKPKCAIIACENKLVRILNRLVAKNELWEPNFGSAIC